jgi:hypothetical protein
MTATGLVRPAVERARSGHWLLGPPGVLFWLGVAFAAWLVLDASSRDSFSLTMIAIPTFWFVAGCWLLRFLAAGWADRLRWRPSRWLRWLAVPAFLGAIWALAISGVAADARYAASRAGMDQAAAEVMAGGTTDRGWIGLYPAEFVERTENGMRFLVSSSGFIDREGYAYAIDGRPRVTYDDGAEYTELGGGWWRWIAPFD